MLTPGCGGIDRSPKAGKNSKSPAVVGNARKKYEMPGQKMERPDEVSGLSRQCSERGRGSCQQPAQLLCAAVWD